jgi:hypothetical protein
MPCAEYLRCVTCTMCGPLRRQLAQQIDSRYGLPQAVVPVLCGPAPVKSASGTSRGCAILTCTPYGRHSLRHRTGEKAATGWMGAGEGRPPTLAELGRRLRALCRAYALQLLPSKMCTGILPNVQDNLMNSTSFRSVGVTARVAAVANKQSAPSAALETAFTPLLLASVPLLLGAGDAAMPTTTRSRRAVRSPQPRGRSRLRNRR